MFFNRVAALFTFVVFAPFLPGQSWTGYGHDAQHTGDSMVASQALNKIKWSASIDTVLQGASGPLLIHYGTPVITASNTVLVAQRTSSGNSYQVNAFSGSAGTPLYTLSTAYTPPPHSWIPSFGTALGLGSRYFYPGPGGTVLYRDTPDSVTGNSGQLALYGLSMYQANQSQFDGNVMISTPDYSRPLRQHLFRICRHRDRDFAGRGHPDERACADFIGGSRIVGQRLYAGRGDPAAPSR